MRPNALPRRIRGVITTISDTASMFRRHLMLVYLIGTSVLHNGYYDIDTPRRLGKVPTRDEIHIGNGTTSSQLWE